MLDANNQETPNFTSVLCVLGQSVLHELGKRCFSHQDLFLNMNFHTFIPNNPQIIVQLKDEQGKGCATKELELEKKNEGKMEVRRVGS